MPADRRPLAGQTVSDHDGRVLRVDLVRIGDPAGREIRGKLLTSGASYATDFVTFRDVWVERIRSRTPTEQEAVRKGLKV